MSLKNAEKKENNRVELEIEVDAAAFEAAVQKAYKKDVQKMSIPGFRKGKAPRALLEREFGSGIFYETAMNDVYPGALDEAIKESGYTYVEDKIDLDVVSVGPEGLVFKATITVKPEVTVDGYKGLKATKKVAPVTDEDIDEDLKRLQERNARMVSVEDRAAEMGDTVTLDYEGFVDGVAFDGGKGENHALELGSGNFIPGFEEQLVDGLIECLTADIPAAMYERAIDDEIRGQSYRMQSMGISMEMYLQYTGMDQAAFRESFRERAEKQVKVRLALEGVAKKENIEVTAEDVEAEYAKCAEQYQVDVDTVKKSIPESAIKEDLAVSKAMDLVKENAVVTEE